MQTSAPPCLLGGSHILLKHYMHEKLKVESRRKYQLKEGDWSHITVCSEELLCSRMFCSRTGSETEKAAELLHNSVQHLLSTPGRCWTDTTDGADRSSSQIRSRSSAGSKTSSCSAAHKDLIQPAVITGGCRVERKHAQMCICVSGMSLRKQKNPHGPAAPAAWSS